MNSTSLPGCGEAVRVRSRTYLVEGVEADPGAGGTLVELACLDDDAQGQHLEVVWELELGTEILNREAWQSIGKRGFDDPRQFSAYLHTLRWNCVTATDPRIFQAPFRAGIRIDAYQLEPLRKALLLPRVNLFIADDTGLGKTIEAGLIATELLLRRRVKDVVVACPPSMVDQWKEEFEIRFGLTFEVMDRAYIERVRQQRGYGVNPWTTFPRFLVSQRLLVDETYVGPMRDWLGSLRPAALLILDEAHHAAPSSGARYAIDSRITRAIRDIAPRFEHRLFLSATPHNGHSNSFSALLELLDPHRFIRGVKVLKGQLDPVMVRRLKEDIRALEGGFPTRKLMQVDLDGLPSGAPELKLSELLDKYRDVRQRRMSGTSKRKQADAALLISGLQQRLLSSVEAFARTLAVHRRTMERLWAGEKGGLEGRSRMAGDDLVAGALGADDDRSLLSETQQYELEVGAIESVTMATAGDAAAADVGEEKRLLTEMEQVAEQGRGIPDARVQYLVQWVRKHMCSGACNPGSGSPTPDAPWTDLRLLIFTEYEATLRYLVNMLRAAIAGTDLWEQRIEVFHGPTPSDKRTEIKRAFNLAPSAHPIRILVATDAAREGLNLQAHCHNLFHFDVPWNPSRLEQRNGRIDRKLQPAPEVFCHYFVYKQRPEDKVLRALVKKTDIIRQQLGSLAEVLETRLSETIRGGILRKESERMAEEIDKAGLDKERQASVTEELDAVRERREDLEKQISTLRNRVNEARKWIGLDAVHFRDALSCSLELLGTKPLAAAGKSADGIEKFAFPDLQGKHGGDPTWSSTLDTLREPPKEGRRDFAWRKDAPIRPVVFDPPQGVDDEVVQLHLSHRVVQRLLGRFLAQGFVHHDLSRACFAQSADAIPRVVLIGRLSLYGKGASRLHEEIVTVTARWADAASRKSTLSPYGRDAESKTLELLEQSLLPGASRQVPEQVVKRLQASIARDIEELLPHLEARGAEERKGAETKLAERGRIESQGMRKILEEQRVRVRTEFGKDIPAQLCLDLHGEESKQQQLERRQYESNRRYWQRWLEGVERDLRDEPTRIDSFYQVVSARLEPVGLAYLWPVTG